MTYYSLLNPSETKGSARDFHSSKQKKSQKKSKHRWPSIGTESGPQQTSFHAAVYQRTAALTRPVEKNALLSDIIPSFSVLKPLLSSPRLFHKSSPIIASLSSSGSSGASLGHRCFVGRVPSLTASLDAYSLAAHRLISSALSCSHLCSLTMSTRPFKSASKF